MARAGQCRPYNARFQNLHSGGCLYVMEVGGAIKVGRTSMATHRLITLREIHAKRGEEIGRFCILPVDGRGFTQENAERDAIHALMAVATPLPRRREYFSGIDYDAAVALVREVVATHSPTVPALPRAVVGRWDEPSFN